LYEGAQQILGLLPEKSFESISVLAKEERTVENDILGYSSLLRHLQEAHGKLETSNAEKLVTIGGDCSVDVAPVWYLNKKYKGDLAVLWIDAHADLNTPASSPSKAFHGMVLRTLLGEGDARMLELSPLKLFPDQVFLVGTREFDPPELAYFEENRIRLIGVRDIEHNADALIEVVQARGFKNVHIHLDLDVLDPASFSSTCYPTANGVSLDSLIELMQLVKGNLNVVGFTLTEYAPVESKDLENVKKILESIPLS
jgi:arginase